MKTVDDFRFTAVIRTQGKRPALLAEALASLSLQRPACAALVTVHAPRAALEPVTAICRDAGVDYNVLHAEDVSRKRGYPINVALAHCYDVGGIEALFFLDDDDIVYPHFTRRMAQAFVTSEADVVYAASNRRHPGRPPEPAYKTRPLPELLVENFIPINSYAIRFSRLAAARPFFDETIDYTEDWLFLLQLLERGFRFQGVDETLSEFRITSDGNMKVKHDMLGWERDALKIREYINTTCFTLAGDILVEIAKEINGPPRSIGGGPGPGAISVDPNALLLFEHLLRWWYNIPFSMRKTIFKLYDRLFSRYIAKRGEP